MSQASLPEKNVSFADVVKKNLFPAQKAAVPRLTLDKYKLYLDSCATYHMAFYDQCLHNVRTVDRVLKGNCNAGVVTSSEKGFFGKWDLWLNRNGIANLLSISLLEECGYVVDYNIAREWVIMTPQGTEIVFHRDTGLCNRMPYIDMRNHKDVVLMVQNVHKNFEGYTR